MGQAIRIALDAMGGDNGPAIVLDGAAQVAAKRADVSFEIYGDKAVVEPLLAGHSGLNGRAKLHHSDVSIRMDEKPSQAIRSGRRVSSMWMAIEAVKRGDADVTVSAGNTGALMAMSKVCLRTMPQIDRPAIAALWPTTRGRSIVLDVGATIGADAEHLVDMSIMGAAMARIVLGIAKPTVGLLNVGIEEIKGLEEVKAAGRMLREAALPDIDYKGFVEGDDLGRGTVDVVVTEGFTGNIALKTAEGTAKQIAHYLREAMGQSWMSKLGYLLAKPAFEALRVKLDPRRVNGGVFLGLDGIVIKSHGGTDGLGFAGAIEMGYDMAHHELLGKIRESLAASHDIRMAVSGFAHADLH